VPGEITRRHLPASRHSTSDANATTPATPQPVFALTVDYTSMTQEDLESIRTIIGGGNGPVIKQDPTQLITDVSRDRAFQNLTRALAFYPCTQLYLLVPWGMPAVEEVVGLIHVAAHQRPNICFVIGRDIYSIELCMAINPLSEGDAELRQDPELNSPDMQQALRILTSGFGDSL
jgi:hypothetical protein